MVRSKIAKLVDCQRILQIYHRAKHLTTLPHSHDDYDQKHRDEASHQTTDSAPRPSMLAL